MTKQVSYLVLSDVHLGHKKNTTENIISNLDVFFDNYTNTSRYTSLDIIFIAGDLFDGLLDMDSLDIHLIQLWMDRLIRFCANHDIFLRVLKGTPSHDWGQSSVFETVWKICQLKNNFKYINTLFIEHIEKYNLHVLYVPDEWTSTTEETLNQVKQLLKDNGLKQVDIAIMHGMFNYQLPDVGRASSKHNEIEYLSLVRYFINIGHIHTHSVYERILAQGSFDRLAHGEEEPKGAMLMTLDKINGNKYFFIENKQAKIFKTLTLKSLDADASVSYIEKKLSKIPSDAYIRLKAAKNHAVYIGFEQLKIRFPFYNFSKMSLEDENESVYNARVNLLMDNDYSSIQINKENINNLLLESISKRHTLTNDQQTVYSKVMEVTMASVK
jgi:DNA repair exonuclease SbcCD nuclease subunit